MNLIKELSSEQELLIPSFIEKWQEIAFSTEPTNKIEIERAIKKIYSKLKLAEPIIYYCDRPTSTYDVLQNIDLDRFGSSIHSEICAFLFVQIEDFLTAQMTEDLWEQLEDALRISNFDCKPFVSWNFMKDDVLNRFYGFDDIAFYEGRILSRLISYGLTFDFCQMIVDRFSDRLTEIWNIFQVLANNCSQLFFYEDICIAYEKLGIISVDDRGLLHNDGQPAIEFRDGTKIYACHGNTIPEQYGKIPHNQWRVNWLSKAEMRLRDILILGIGESKICQELKTESKINQVGVMTSRQKSLVTEYAKKWCHIFWSTDKLDADLVTNYIHRAYKYLGESEPKILCFSSPLLAQQYATKHKLHSYLYEIFNDKICRPSCAINPWFNDIVSHPFIDHRIIQELEQEFQAQDDFLTCMNVIHHFRVLDMFKEEIDQKLEQVIECIKPEFFIDDSGIQDYLLSNFNCAEETERIEIFVGLMQNCGWIYPYKEVCLVCDRQTITYDSGNFD
ncbi:MAG: hypothetical protein AAFO95_07405 [Cyanobacteria bacterium J06600_6]